MRLLKLGSEQEHSLFDEDGSVVGRVELYVTLEGNVYALSDSVRDQLDPLWREDDRPG